MSNEITGHRNQVAIASNASEEVRKNLNEFFRDKSGFSENTWKMLKYVAKSFSTWCEENNAVFLPADPEDVRLYLLGMQEKGLKVKTINLHLQMINMIHKRAGLPRPSDSNSASLVMRRIQRENVDAGEQADQAMPFQRRDLERLRGKLSGSRDIQHIRMLAILGLAYNTLLRIAEISRIRIKDLTLSDEGRYQIRITRTKTLVSTSGQIKTLSLDVTALVSDWIDVSGADLDPNNFLFCRILKNGSPSLSAEKGLTPKSIEETFKSAYLMLHATSKNKVGRYKTWSGHSARVGAAQDMAKAGVSPTEIMQAGGWSSIEMVMSYIRNLESESGAMIRLLESD